MGGVEEVSIPDTKKPALLAGFFVSGRCFGLRGQGFHLCVKTALVPRCLVLVDDALIGQTVDNGYGAIVSGFCYGRVTATNGGSDFLDHCANQRAQTGIVRASLFCLAGAFPCLW